MYFAPGATHAPHHVPKEWADKYKGKFDDGWDRQRELTLARQKELGVVPRDAELTKRQGSRGLKRLVKLINRISASHQETQNDPSLNGITPSILPPVLAAIGPWGIDDFVPIVDRILSLVLRFVLFLLRFLLLLFATLVALLSLLREGD
jgi:hypothetical protein